MYVTYVCIVCVYVCYDRYSYVLYSCYVCMYVCAFVRCATLCSVMFLCVHMLSAILCIYVMNAMSCHVMLHMRVV